MPRVSAEHLAARREQILNAARRCFVREGFHATTMADVIAESGLSAGAVYRYFPGKEDLIRAAVQGSIERVAEIDEAASWDLLPDLSDVLAGFLDRIEALSQEAGVDVTKVALMAWAESMRSPAIQSIMSTAITSVRARLAGWAKQAQDAGRLSPDTDPDAVAKAAISLVMGYAVQRNVAGDLDRATYLAGVRALTMPPAIPPPPPERTQG